MEGKAVKQVPNSIDVALVCCRGVQDVDSVKRVAHLLVEEGFRPAPAGQDHRFYACADVDACVDVQFLDWRTASGEPVVPESKLLSNVPFPVLVDGFPQERAYCAFGWDMFKGGFAVVGLSASVTALPEQQADWYQPFATKFLSLATRLYALARPVFGFLSNPDLDPNPSPYTGNVKKRRIATLNWVNLFGPEYVTHYGREMLAGIPGYRTQDLPDGGLLYQSRARVTVDDKRVYRAWQREATGYMLAHGVRLRWRNVFRP